MTPKELENYCDNGPFEGVEQHHMRVDEMDPDFQKTVIKLAYDSTRD